MATLMYLTMENRGLAQVCQNLGWTLLENDDNGNDVFNCTNPPQGDPLRCFVQVTMPFLGELSALDDEFASVGGVRGGKTELIAFHAMVSILAVRRCAPRGVRSTRTAPRGGRGSFYC